MDNLNGDNGNEPIKPLGPGKKRFSDTMIFFIILGIIFLTSLITFISLNYQRNASSSDKTSQSVENKEEKKVLNTIGTVRKQAKEEYERLENLVAQEEQKENKKNENVENKTSDDKKAYLTPSTNTVISEEQQQEIIDEFQETFTGENLKEVNGELVYTDPSGEVHMSFNDEGYMDRMYTVFDCEDIENLETYRSMFEMFGFKVTNTEGTTLVIEMPLDGYEEMTKDDIIKAFNGEY